MKTIYFLHQFWCKPKYGKNGGSTFEAFKTRRSPTCSVPQKWPELTRAFSKPLSTAGEMRNIKWTFLHQNRHRYFWWLLMYIHDQSDFSPLPGTSQTKLCCTWSPCRWQECYEIGKVFKSMCKNFLYVLHWNSCEAFLKKYTPPNLIMCLLFLKL